MEAPAMSDRHMLDLVVVVIYLVGTLALGARFLRGSNTTEGFTVGSRALPSWAIGLSILGSFVSSISFLGNPGKAYSDNWAPFLFALTVPVVAILGGRVFIPLYRRRESVSAYAFLEERFGLWARTYGTLSFQLLQLGWVSVILYLAALVVAPTLSLSVPAVIVVIGLLVTIYTMLGGIKAVIWTDVVQVIIMSIGALWCLVILFTVIPGGPPEIIRIAREAGGKFDLGEMSLRLDSQTFLAVLLYGILTNLQNFGVDQNYVQRYHAARNERDARKAILVAVLPFVPVTALFLAIGTGLFAFYRVYPDLLPEGVAGDMVFPYFIRTELPPGISGLLIASILAAAMSTISCSLNCMATVFVEDVYRRWFRPEVSDREQVFLLRVLTVVWGVGGTALGIVMIGNKSGLDLFWQISAIVGSGLLGIFLVAILPRPIHVTAVKVSTVAAVVFVLWETVSGKLAFLPSVLRIDIDPLLLGALGTGLLVALSLGLHQVFSLVPGRRGTSG